MSFQKWATQSWLRLRADRLLDVARVGPSRRDWGRLLRPPADTVGFTVMPFGALHDRDRVAFVGALPLFFEVVIPPAPQPHPTAGYAGQSLPAMLQPHLARPEDFLPKLPMVPGMPKLAMPLPSQFPPPYDPGLQSAPAAGPERPLKDIRAVLVEIG